MTRPLSRRLTTILDNVPDDARAVADVGADHGRLALALALLRGLDVVATELRREPFGVLERNIAKVPGEPRISARMGYGLEPLEPFEVEVICVAGMGGGTIAKILERGRDKLQGVRRLVLQPMNMEVTARRWLRDNGWGIVDEHLVIEQAPPHYVVIVAEPGAPCPYEGLDGVALEAALRVGPILGPRRAAETVARWALRRGRLDDNLANIPLTEPEARARLEQEIKTLDNFLHQA